LTEEIQCKAEVLKFEQEAELTKSRYETSNVRDELHTVKVVSDGLSQDKIELNRIITQVRHFLACHCSVVVKDLWLEDKGLRSEDKDLRSKDKGLRSEDKGLRSEDKDLWLEDKDKDMSVYANWTTAATLFAIKIKTTCAQ